MFIVFHSSALNLEVNQKVAIKKIPKGLFLADWHRLTNSLAFSNLVETKRTLREVKLLRHFKHANVLHRYISDYWYSYCCSRAKGSSADSHDLSFSSDQHHVFELLLFTFDYPFSAGDKEHNS